MELLDPDYAVGVYTTFQTSSSRPPVGMGFDPDGNLYVTHHQDADGNDGEIFRIDLDKNVTKLATGLARACDGIWAGGTAYGESLYITEAWAVDSWPGGSFTQIGLDGSVTPFSGTGLNQPVALEIDRYGNYGELMYVSSSANDRISTVSPTGDVQTFYTFPSNTGSGGAEDIAIDPCQDYGGLLYAATNFVDAPGLSGVLSFDTEGNPSQLTAGMRRGFQLEFDTTEGKVFGGLLYVLGRREWSGDTAVFRVYPDGQIEEFITGIYFRSELEFGPDNCLYVMEANFSNNDVTISRIGPSYMEPIWKIEQALEEKEQAIAKIISAKDKEMEAFEMLNAMLEAHEYGGLERKNIAKAKRKIKWAMRSQNRALLCIDWSMVRLEDALEELGYYFVEEE